MNDAVIGFIGVVIGALSTLAGDLLRYWFSRQRNAKFLAIRVVSMLDRFVEGCAGVATDKGGVDSDGVYRVQNAVPKFDVELLDVEWKAIPAQLMYEILNFPDVIYVANHRIAEAFEFSDPPDYEDGFETRQDLYAKLGLRALEIGDKLRHEYGIPARACEDWDPNEYFDAVRNEIEKKRAQRRERRLAMWDPIQSDKPSEK